MNRYWLVLLLLLAACAVPGVSAAYNENFTVQLEAGEDFAHYNESYHIYDRQYTPKWLFDDFLYLAFGCLFLSFVLAPKQRADLFGYLAPLPFLIASLMCTGLSGIDVVTGYGATSTIEIPGTGVSNPNLGEYVMMMGHNVYVIDMLAVFLFIMFVVSLINCYRVYMEHEMFQQSVGGGTHND